MSADSITVRRRRAYSVVPDDVMEDLRLSLRSRAVLAWMIGRPEGWEIRVGHMRRVLGLSEHVWAAVRDEITAAGYYRQWQERDAAGRIVWVREVSDTTSVGDGVAAATTPSPKTSRMDGARHGDAMHGDVEDIPVCTHHHHLPPPPTPSPTPAHQVAGGGGATKGDDLADLHSALVAEGRRAGKAHPDRWAAAAIRRVRAQGMTPEDAAMLAEWRRVITTSCEATKQASCRPPPDDPAARARGEALLAEARARRDRRDY